MEPDDGRRRSRSVATAVPGGADRSPNPAEPATAVLSADSSAYQSGPGYPADYSVGPGHPVGYLTGPAYPPGPAPQPDYPAQGGPPGRLIDDHHRRHRRDRADWRRRDRGGPVELRRQTVDDHDGPGSGHGHADRGRRSDDERRAAARVDAVRHDGRRRYARHVLPIRGGGPRCLPRRGTEGSGAQDHREQSGDRPALHHELPARNRGLWCVAAATMRSCISTRGHETVPVAASGGRFVVALTVSGCATDEKPGAPSSSAYAPPSAISPSVKRPAPGPSVAAATAKLGRHRCS